MTNLVIVESPAKAKTINKYLGSNYEVVASFGHVRDLPSKDGSVDPEADFAMLWEIDGKATKRMSDIAAAAKGSEKVILATDPDREGEAISWHILEILKSKRVLKDVKVERVTFNAITKQAVEEAMRAPRPIDQALVDAYLARRALDYLVGFNLSPVLWRKLPGARSAGRVQSVALRLVCDREMDIERFTAREYWSLIATLKTAGGELFEARLAGTDGKKITRLDVGTQTEALAFKQALDAASFTVTSVESKPAKRHPYPPFTTSTLQQEASRKLGLAPAAAMRVAQKLYEGIDLGGETVGLITYMRTDGVQMAGEAVDGVRRLIANDFGDRYLPGKPRAYSAKAKNAQEAHEAIRPTDVWRTPEKMRKYLGGEEFKLYELIWKRTMASQMESAELERTAVDILADGGGRTLELRATGQVVRFDGFLTLYTEDKDDEEDEEGGRLPLMRKNDALAREKIAATQHFTEPPPRFTEASLVKKMEELGIGRPSTYASTLQVLRDREYVRLEKKRLVAEDKGRLVTAFLESFFARYVEFDFTANLENQLDRISNNEIEWKEVMRQFWRDFSLAIGGTKELRTTEVLDKLDALLGPHLFPRGKNGEDTRSCQRCGTGRMGLKLSKTGPFIGCSNYPECRNTRPFGVASPDGEGDSAGGVGADGSRNLGDDPATGMAVTARVGRFGPFVQLGDGEKPKRSSIPKGLSIGEITLEQALSLLSLPREVGKHPEDGEPIMANNGKFGPYVQHLKTYANLTAGEDVLTIGLNRAVDLIATKLAKGPGRFQRSAPQGRPIGDHPDGGVIQVLDGKYGAYVKWTDVNATIPKTIEKDAITLEQALDLIRARQAAAPAKKTTLKKTAAKKAAPAKKAVAPKKTAAKKTAAKK
ncbi:MAG: type I DNA topoisomerase [Beijerinckiaceae bacterium]